MATIDKKQTRWYAESTFNALNKSTIPAGTEIHVDGKLTEDDLSDGVKSKLNGGAVFYKHNVSVPCVTGGDTTKVFTLKLNIISSSATEYTFNSLCEEILNGNDKVVLPCIALTPVNDSFTTGAMMVYDLVADYTDEIYGLTVKALLFEDFDGAMQPEREMTCGAEIGDAVFGDTVIQL